MERSRPAPATSPGTRASSVLRLEGGDTLDLLHRISTQFLLGLSPGACRAAPFCDFRGRLLHRAVVAATHDGALWLLRDDAPGDALAAFLDSNVFREDVRVADLGARWSAYTAPGRDGPAVGAVEERDGVPVRARVTTSWTLGLVRAGAALPSEDEAARIREGRPRHGHEIHPDFTPFEVGLAHEVHLAKGCYPGQEALMRLVTYRSVRRRLALLGGEGGAPVPPADVRTAGAVGGRLTSVAGAATGWIGLAVLRHAAVAPGARLEIEGAGPVREPAPFALTDPLGVA